MTVRINANSCKNALGTVFLLATVFFVCSTFISMRSVFADPIAPVNTTGVQQTGRQSPRSVTRTSNRTIARTTASRGTATATRSAVSRAGGTTRAVSSRAATSTRSNAATRSTSRGNTRSVTSRNQRGTTNQNANRSVRARTATSNKSRVSANGNIMSSDRASVNNTTYSYLNSRLYSGNYSNIVDSTTGMISAEAYANCMDSYYACMDEICTARSSTKGRCSCAGRATNFLEAETALERANEELIQLSGQLALLIATKGKGDDLAAAFSLTDAEKVMNCVSWRDAKIQVDNGTNSEALDKWYETHTTYPYDGSMNDGTSATQGMPDYCNRTNNNLNFDVSELDGSSSDILAKLKAWADAKDLAKQYDVDTNNYWFNYNGGWSAVFKRLGISPTATKTSVSQLEDSADLDSVANKWGYKLFEYAHNNVCSRVLDSCFNGIYEACGTPPTVTDSDGKTHNKCQNGQSSQCPYNFNSYISVQTDSSKDNYGDIELNERGSANNATVIQSASCFGYSTTTTAAGIRSTAATSTNDPYYSLRGPVADARRSIMQKYLLDANSACDIYGENLTNTAQNINYQKVAAEQALQQKRLEFRQDEINTNDSNSATYASNFVTCQDELIDCYNSADTTWTTARIKTYCAQKSQVPHCYEPMICSPSHLSLKAVIDQPDSKSCAFEQDFRKNTCRNIVTISEILYGANSAQETYDKYGALEYGMTGINSAELRESCLQATNIPYIRKWSISAREQYECTAAQLNNTDPFAVDGYNITADEQKSSKCAVITKCASGYQLDSTTSGTTTTYKCTKIEVDCSGAIEGATKAHLKVVNNVVTSECVLDQCKTNFTPNGNVCVADTVRCENDDLADRHAQDGIQTYTDTGVLGACQITYCYDDFHLKDNECHYKTEDCSIEHAPSAKKTWDVNAGDYGPCKVDGDCEENYQPNADSTACVPDV